MFGSTTLDVLIGLVTVYLAFGIACTAIVNGAGGALKKRATYLDQALRGLLAGHITDTKPFIDAFYNHPLLRTLDPKGSKPVPPPQEVKPDSAKEAWFRRPMLWARNMFLSKHTYVPPEIVGRVVADIILTDSQAASITDAIQNFPGTTEDNPIKGLLTILAKEVNGNAGMFQEAIESQFNAAMKRASQRYKAFTQRFAFFAALALVVCANVDTIAIAKSLELNPAARKELVQEARSLVASEGPAQITTASPRTRANIPASEVAKKVATQGASEPAKEGAKPVVTESASESLEKAKAVLESTGIQFGWVETPAGRGAWFEKIVGLLVSIFAVSLGAPFWFTALQRFMQARDALTPGKGNS